MEKLINTKFFQVVSGDDGSLNIKELYKDFTYTVFELCNNMDEITYIELIFTLHHTNIELNSLQEQCETDNNVALLHYIRKAVSFTERAIRHVVEHEEVYLKSNSEIPAKIRKWTGKIVELVEIIYGIDTKKSVENGELTTCELADYIGRMFGVELKDCYSAYVDMKRRKNNSRTYFLDELSRLLNDRMDRDDMKG